jgi:sugar phosphate isomerase/epimerase
MNLLAFSTLGCPSWDIDRILSGATEYGYDAVELRGYLGDMDLPKAAPFTPENRAETLARFADAGSPSAVSRRRAWSLRGMSIMSGVTPRSPAL